MKYSMKYRNIYEKFQLFFNDIKSPFRKRINFKTDSNLLQIYFASRTFKKNNSRINSAIFQQALVITYKDGTDRRLRCT